MKVGTGTFPLRLPKSTRQQAVELAQNEGLSLNQFITLAVTEKIVRLEQSSPTARVGITPNESALPATQEVGRSRTAHEPRL